MSRNKTVSLSCYFRLKVIVQNSDYSYVLRSILLIHKVEKPMNHVDNEWKYLDSSKEERFKIASDSRIEYIEDILINEFCFK